MHAWHRFRLTVIAVVSGAMLGGCAQLPEPEGEPEPAVVEEIDGTDLHRITLSARAAQRLGIETVAAETIAVEGSAGDRLVIPSSALFYTSDGGTWAYANPEPLVFERAGIDLDYVAGDLAVLRSGDADMVVVTIGAAELFGAESGLGAGGH